MSDELEMLRADLKVLEKYKFTEAAQANCREKIAELEAAANPWREAIEFAEDNEGSSARCGHAARYIHHLTAEIAAKERRIAELEAAEHDRLQDEEIEKIWQDQQDDEPIATPQPPSETAWVESELAQFVEAGSDEPGPLDPARVLATARTYLNNSRDDIHGSISYLMWCHVKESQDAKPYKLKGADK